MPVSLSSKMELELLLERKKRLTAKSDLAVFSEYLTGFQAARHHALICRKLEAVANGKINRLLIAAPPGSAKTTYVNLAFPAWYLGRNPDKLVITASHTAELAETMSGKVRNLIADERYGNIFPKTRISKDSKSKGRWSTMTKGEYFATGVGGAVAGRRGDLIIIDDPFRSRADAESKARRELVDSWYKADIYTRLKPGGAIVLIATRWHPDDLSGRLLARALAGEGDKWDTLILQAVCEDPENDPLGRQFGESIWPEWFSEEMLEGVKRTVSVREWESLYMQRPAPLEGGMVGRDWFKWYKTLPEGEPAKITQSWDMGNTDSDRADPSVCLTWAQIGNRHFLLNVWKKKVEFPELLKAVKDQAIEWNPSAVLIENKGHGQTTIQTLGGGNWNYNIIKIQPEGQGSKSFRYDLVTPMFSDGKVFVPGEGPEACEKWVDEFVYELLTFPNNMHDDQVDATSQYLSWASPNKGRRGMAKLRG